MYRFHSSVLIVNMYVDLKTLDYGLGSTVDLSQVDTRNIAEQDLQ